MKNLIHITKLPGKTLNESIEISGYVTQDGKTYFKNGKKFIIFSIDLDDAMKVNSLKFKETI